MVPANNGTGEPVDCPYFIVSVIIAWQVRASMESCSLVIASLAHGHAVGAPEPREHVQSDTAFGAAATDRI